MSTEVLKILEKDMDRLRAGLSDYHPQTKEDCVKFIHLRSAFNAQEKRIAQEAYHFLETRCKDCDVHEVDGLAVLRIQQEKKVYNQTEELKKAEEALEQAKIDLEVARMKAGFTLQDGPLYYKVTKREGE